MPHDKLQVTCPCCEARLLVDAETGSVIRHDTKETEGKKRGSASMADMIADLDRQRQTAAEKVEKEKQHLKDRGRLLEEKVMEAMKRVDKSDPTPPIRPFDLD